MSDGVNARRKQRIKRHRARAAMYEQIVVACQAEKARRRHMSAEGINRV